ncbi:MAG: alpha/beta hydrolase [Chitinophagaceae bacterium]
MKASRKVNKAIFKAAQVMLVLYALIGILLWTFQDKLLFQSTQLPSTYVYQFKEPHKELVIRLNEKDNLSIVQFFPVDRSKIKGVILYFHGNKENINHYAEFVPQFTKYGYEVWMMDYPGYGKSTGVVKEDRFYSDAFLLYKMAVQKFSSEKVVVYGKSLGTGVAAELASHVSCHQLILETPYYSISSLVSAYFPVYPAESMVQYKFPLYEYLQQVQEPVTIFHGTADEVIPYENARQLISLLKSNDDFVTIEKGTHHNLSSFTLYQHKLDSLLAF